MKFMKQRKKELHELHFSRCFWEGGFSGNKPWGLTIRIISSRSPIKNILRAEALVTQSSGRKPVKVSVSDQTRPPI